MKNNKSVVIGGLVVLVIILGVLFYLPRLGKKSIVTDIPCLAPNLPLVQHIHPVLTITIDGKADIIPANIGLGGVCEHALHTHDDTGTIHVEAQDARKYTLGDFYSIWGEQIMKDGYKLEAIVDEVAMPANGLTTLVLQDKQQIILTYTKQ